MATNRKKDRDGLISEEGIIFRVYGYWHPPKGHVCDVEYAPSSIYRSKDPKAPRTKGADTYYKFYEDSGLAFIDKQFPKHHIFYEPLQQSLVGINDEDVATVRYPNKVLQNLLSEEPKDELIRTLHEVLDEITSRSNLKTSDFGVFGSLLHGFYHPSYSDIDLTVIGRRELQELLDLLETIHSEEGGILLNEFQVPSRWSKGNWRFKRLSLDEYGWFQRRKLIYNIYSGKSSTRPINVEFEPVKADEEILNEYDPNTRIRELGRVDALGTVTDDSDGPYMPAIFGVELDPIQGVESENVQRIVSYVEEFRMQVKRGERIRVVGNLEEVKTPRDTFKQIVLTYCPDYYGQVLKLD